MGLLAKAATKKRVQPASGPVNGALAGTPWLTNGGIPAGALIRSAVFALDLTGARSNSLRGRQHVLTTLVAPTYASHLWVETSDFRTWDFVLGVDNGREGIAADWAIRLTVTKTATVATLRWLTNDGTLVHGAQHDALRQELLRALALGEQADRAGEEEISASSLKAALPFPAASPEPFSLSFSLVTALDEDTIRKRLTLLGYRGIDDSASGLRWGLGLPRHDQADHVTLTPGPGALAGRADVGSPGGPGRRLAARALRKFISRAAFLIGSADESVRYEGPEEWRP